MQTRRATRVAVHPALGAEALAPLPRWFVHAVLLLLPVDTRLRCSEVSRAWRALLADKSLWECIDLSLASGCSRFSLLLFRTTVAKAGGTLRSLDVTGRRASGISSQKLHSIAKLNAATLKDLRIYTHTHYSTHAVGALLRAAPSLDVLEVGVYCNVRDARLMLRNEAPFAARAAGALRLRELNVFFVTPEHFTDGFLADLRGHTALETLWLQRAPLLAAAAVGAVVDAAVALRLSALQLLHCSCRRDALPHLARLIAAGHLRELVIADADASLFEGDAGGVAAFCAAARASHLTTFEVISHLGGIPPAVAETTAFIAARGQ